LPDGSWKSIPSLVTLRFAAVYAFLALSLAGAALVGLHSARTPMRDATPHCWVSDGTLGAALYKAARCRFGTARVAQLGWMPYLGSLPGESRAEVSVLDPFGKRTFWIADYAPGRRIEVRHWSPCAATNEYC
jgi:hypothetical protein